MIKIICVGRIKEKYIKELVSLKINEINRRYEIKIIEVADYACNEGQEKQIKLAIKKEGENILAKINKNDLVIGLAIEGRRYGLKEIKNIIAKNFKLGRDILFIIGGSYGLSKKLLARADYLFSISKMTFPHQLMRYIILDIISGL